MQDIELAYRNLASAIVLQAVTDYRNARNGVSYNHKPPETIIEDVENFFRSSYYRRLTNINGEYLIQQLQKEHLERSNNESNVDTGNA